MIWVIVLGLYLLVLHVFTKKTLEYIYQKNVILCKEEKNKIKIMVNLWFLFLPYVPLICKHTMKK